MLTLGHIIEPLSTYTATGTETAVASVVMDSREVVAGSVFVAYAGEQVDGHAFVEQAFAAGAVAALVERPFSGEYHTLDLRAGQNNALSELDETELPICLLVEDTIEALQTAAKAWRNRFDVEVIGITGSVGKTSTKDLTHSVLSQKYNTFKSPGNRNSVLGLPMALFGLREHHEKAVLEMGMYVPGEIATLCEMSAPQVGLVTLIGAVHMERAGSMEAIVAAKQELVEALPAHGVAILNKDDSRVMSMAAHTQARIFTYGLDPMADVWADNIESMGLKGIRFVLHHRGDEAMTVQVPLLGRHSVHTSLRAAAVGLVEGLSWDEIVRGLRETAVQLKLVTVPGPKNSTIIDDTYNANPESMMAALNLLADLPGRRVAVLGDMLELGHVEEAAHRLIGRRVADVAQRLVAVGRRAEWIAEEALKVGMLRAHVVMVVDVDTAVSVLEELIVEQDMILVKGSLGMQMDKIINALGRYD